VRELELTLKLRNNCLKSRRLALGMTAKDMAKLCGVSHGVYCAYETMKSIPIGRPNRIRKTDWWKPSALAIAKFHGCSVTELWPEVVLAVNKPVVVVEMEGEKALALASMALVRELPPMPDDLLESKEMKESLQKAMSRCLSPRERKLLDARFVQEKTLTVSGKKIGVCSERARQMQERIIEKLRKAMGVRCD